MNIWKETLDLHTDQWIVNMPTINPIEQAAISIGANILVNIGPKLVQNETVRRQVVGIIEHKILSGLKQPRTDANVLPGIADDRAVMGLGILGSVERSLSENLISKSSLITIVNILKQAVIDEKGDQGPVARFQKEYGIIPPSFLVISPGKACNLHCTGCYADSSMTAEKLDWEIVDRLITEARTLWGTRLYVFSGGEPFAYRSKGKGILELMESHPDCVFIMFTNGTLINEKVSQRLAYAGNVLPAISVEGWKERTDARRGEGVFDRILEAMKALRSDRVPFGISLTGTCQNAEEILSEAFIDFFQQQGALYAWLFQYMPIGRSYTLDLLPSPEQRVWMWRRSWEIVRDRRMFIADFWNSGTACDGCLSAGGHGRGGYFYIDWNGAVSPCVFLPYSPTNINDVYARGGTLNDVWNEPFFHRIRKWQLDHNHKNGNGMAPCPYRDHYADLLPILMEYEPDPIDENAAAALQDPAYAQGLTQYGAAYESLTHNIWENYYVHRTPGKDGGIEPLPDIPNRD
jgi:MoaA/NifB/PqqE/SkfB family radical SAM enzyme